MGYTHPYVCLVIVSVEDDWLLHLHYLLFDIGLQHVNRDGFPLSVSMILLD